MPYRRLIALVFALALGGILAATLALDPFGANAILSAQTAQAERAVTPAGAWEFYADPETVRRNSMDRQAKTVSAPNVATARATLQTWLSFVVPLGVMALIAGIALIGRSIAWTAPPPPPPPLPKRKRPSPRRA